MKKIYLISFLTLISVFAFSQWTWQNPLPQGNELLSIFFTDVQHGYVVGDNGTIIKTNDSGATWNFLDSGTKMYLTSVYFTDANIGYVAGNDTAGATILKTTDAGLTWTSIYLETGGRLHTIYFASPNTGYAGGDFGKIGKILKTSDAGKTWSVVASLSNESTGINSFCFTDSNIGYAVGGGGTVLKTKDGGNSWTALETGNQTWFDDVTFTNANTGYAIGNGGILKTIDAGISWAPMADDWSGLLTSICFTDANTGYAAGSDENGGFILKTTDAGASWKSTPSGTTEYLNKVYFVDANNGYAVGAAGTILKTTNGGVTFSKETKLSVPTFNIYPNPTADGFRISGLGMVSAIEISDLNGRVWSSKQVTNNEFIPTDALPCGIYLVRINTSEGSTLKKLVKQ